MNKSKLMSVAKSIVAQHKSVLAADESNPTMRNNQSMMVVVRRIGAAW